MVKLLTFLMTKPTIYFKKKLQLFQDIVVENVGMYAHVVNIMVLILIPMVIIHINGHAFSLSMLL